MCNYHCPFADRKACAGFLLCRNLYKEGVNYNVRENAMGVICAYQHQCHVTGKMENSDGAKECYERQFKAQEPQTIPLEKEPEKAPVKKSRKKT